jgi:hypothetical protein
MKRQLEAAVQANAQPKPLKSGKGLVLELPGQPKKRLMDASGAFTPAGRTYFELLGQEVPKRGFDPNQVPRRVGSQMRIKMADGKDAAVQKWDNVRNRWSFTKLGRECFKDSQDTFVVTIPTEELLVRKKESVFLIKSTTQGTNTSIGEIRVPALMTERQQEKAVKAQVDQYLQSLPTIDGKKVIVEGGGSEKAILLDESREL